MCTQIKCVLFIIIYYNNERFLLIITYSCAHPVLFEFYYFHRLGILYRNIGRICVKQTISARG